MRRADAYTIAGLSIIAGALFGSLAERFLFAIASAAINPPKPDDIFAVGFDAFVDTSEQLENAVNECCICGNPCPENVENLDGWHMLSVADGRTPPKVFCSQEHLEVYVTGEA